MPQQDAGNADAVQTHRSECDALARIKLRWGDPGGTRRESGSFFGAFLRHRSVTVWRHQVAVNAT